MEPDSSKTRTVLEATICLARHWLTLVAVHFVSLSRRLTHVLRPHSHALALTGRLPSLLRTDCTVRVEPGVEAKYQSAFTFGGWNLCRSQSRMSHYHVARVSTVDCTIITGPKKSDGTSFESAL